MIECSMIVKDPEQKVYKCDGVDYIPVAFKDLHKDETIKLDVTQKSVYITTSNYYNNTIDVQQQN